jgi:putative DNA methylase
VDPFSGRGTIPLEAKRLGCSVLGTDLNPVAVLISKALVETPGKFANVSPVHRASSRSLISDGVAAIASDVVAYGQTLLEDAKQETLSLYPELDLDGSKWTISAWLWARTIECPNPVCGRSETPLVKSSVLSTKSKPPVHLKPRIDLHSRSVSFDPTQDGSDPFSNVISKRGAVCIFCHELIPLKYIRESASKKRLGRMPMGAVVSRAGQRKFVGSDVIGETLIDPELPEALLDVELTINSRHMGPPVYGLSRHRDLYTRRQLKTLASLAQKITTIRDLVLRDAAAAGMPQDGIRLEHGGRGADGYADAIATYLGLAVSRLADRSSTLAFWQVDETIGHVFVRPALPMTWDFVEVNPFSKSAGSFTNCIDSIAKTIVKLPDSDNASIEMADAQILS